MVRDAGRWQAGKRKKKEVLDEGALVDLEKRRKDHVGGKEKEDAGLGKKRQTEEARDMKLGGT